MKRKAILHYLTLLLFTLPFSFYVFLLHLQVPLNSDLANQVLEANDILSGNLLLSGWNLTGITFFTTELPFYTIGTAIFGVSTYAYIFSAALMYICLFLAGWLLAAQGNNFSLTDFLIYLMIAGMPTVTFLTLLRGHCATFIYLFLAIYCISRYLSKEGELRYLILFGILSALACTGDLLFCVISLLPVIVVTVITLLQNDSQLSRPRSLRSLVSCLISLCAGLGLEKLLLFLGGANKNSFLTRRSFESVSNFPDKAALMLNELLKLWKADFSGQALLSLQTALYFIFSVTLLISLYLLCRVILLFLQGKEVDICSLLLSISILLITLVLFVTDIFAYADCSRYFAYIPIAGAVLIVRQYRLSAIRKARLADNRVPVQSLTIAIAVLTIVLSFQQVQFSRSVTAQDKLAAVLEENGLKYGYAGFWDASSTTVAAKNNVRVRAIKVIAEVQGEPQDIAMHNWCAKTEWYTPDYANFLILDGSGYFEEYTEYINSIFGEPSKTLTEGHYTVLVYDHNIADKIIIPYDAVNRPESAPINSNGATEVL